MVGRINRRTTRRWWGGWVSNPRPRDYESLRCRPPRAVQCHLAGTIRSARPPRVISSHTMLPRMLDEMLDDGLSASHRSGPAVDDTGRPRGARRRIRAHAREPVCTTPRTARISSPVWGVFDVADEGVGLCRGCVISSAFWWASLAGGGAGRTVLRHVRWLHVIVLDSPAGVASLDAGWRFRCAAPTGRSMNPGVMRDSGRRIMATTSLNRRATSASCCAAMMTLSRYQLTRSVPGGRWFRRRRSRCRLRWTMPCSRCGWRP
jgi:hypothetical protein